MAGRGQLKWGSIEALQHKIDEYMMTAKAPTPVGLSAHLGILKDTFNYYANDRYQADLYGKRKQQTDEQQDSVEEIQRQQIENDIMEDAGNTLIVDNGVLVVDDVISLKMQVAATLKKARERMEDLWFERGYDAKNPAFPIYVQKAVFHNYDIPIESDKDSQNALEVRLYIQPPDSPQQLASAQPKPLPIIEVLPDRKQQD
jgi:hypothetical protein